MSWLIILAALAAGAANPFQSGTNTALHKQLGHPLWSSLWVYGSALAGLLVIQAFVREGLPTQQTLGAVRPWAWLGGLISIGPTVAGLMLARRLGSGVFTGLTLTASLLCSVLLDQFGLVGFERHPASAVRVVGCGLMIAGVWCVTRT